MTNRTRSHPCNRMCPGKRRGHPHACQIRHDRAGTSWSEITDRYGKGDYRVTAYGFDPPELRWEVLVEGVGRS